MYGGCLLCPLYPLLVVVECVLLVLIHTPVASHKDSLSLPIRFASAHFAMLCTLIYHHDNDE